MNDDQHALGVPACSGAGARISVVDPGTVFSLALFRDPAGETHRLARQLGVSALPDPGRSVRVGNAAISWFGPRSWLLLIADGKAAKTFGPVFEAVEREALGVVADLSAGYAAVEVTGEQGGDILSKGCSLDIDGFDAFTSVRTSLFGINALIRRLEDRDGYHLLVGRSYRTGLLTQLHDAAHEFASEGQVCA